MMKTANLTSMTGTHHHIWANSTVSDQSLRLRDGHVDIVGISGAIDGLLMSRLADVNHVISATRTSEMH
jgi:hypothetical protein